MQNDNVLQALHDTYKKITDLKEFNVPVITKVIEEYQAGGVDQQFIDEQKVQLEKVNARIHELETKAERLAKRL
ncbi:MAG: hypothetical protein U9N81_10190 [Bacillota bacterium]|nr:hypothetical protein [Bacillota bacterium]